MVGMAIHYRNHALLCMHGIKINQNLEHNLWKAVKVAKNLNLDSIPANLTLGGNGNGNVAESFGSHFNDKISCNFNRAKADRTGFYNGKCAAFDIIISI